MSTTTSSATKAGPPQRVAGRPAVLDNSRPARVELVGMGRTSGHSTRKRATIRRKRARLQGAKHAAQSQCGPVTITKPDGTVVVQPARP